MLSPRCGVEAEKFGLGLISSWPRQDPCRRMLTATGLVKGKSTSLNRSRKKLSWVITSATPNLQ